MVWYEGRHRTQRTGTCSQSSCFSESSSEPMIPLCGPNAIFWIERWFHDCVYTPWQTLAFVIGLSSVCFWLIAQCPQFISNFLRQSADALSPWFLFQWLAGDSFNLLGCLLTGDQLVTETITACYFIFADCLIISQYIYYQIRNQNKPLETCSFNSDDSLKKPMNKCHTIVKNVADPALEVLREQATHLISDRDAKFSLYSEVDLKQQYNWMYEQRHRLRMLVLEYGLEHGPPVVSRHTGQHACKLNGSRLGLNAKLARKRIPVSRTKTHARALLCMIGLIALGSSSWYTFQSNARKMYNGYGLVVDQRPLQELRKEKEMPWFPTHRKNLRGSLFMLYDSSFTSIGRKLMSAENASQWWTKEFGRLLGWISSGLYLGSRISQLIKNKERKSAEGLSLGMVTCAVLANLTYGSSILMQASSWDDWIGKAPWLLGSLGTVFLDLTLIVQAHYLNWRFIKGKPGEHTPLLA